MTKQSLLEATNNGPPATVLLPELYEEVKQKVTQEMAKAEDVAITTDLWTSKAQESFISCTAHYIDPERKILSSVCLKCDCIKGRHTAQNLATSLQGVLNEYSISDKVRAAVTDNGANIKAATQQLRLPSLPCAAHTLNLAMEDAVQNTANVEEFLAQCSTIVTYFKQSTVAAELLQQKRLENGKQALKVIQQVPTRWNSKLHMLRRLDELKPELMAVLVDILHGPRLLDANEWLLIKEMAKVMGPLEEMTEMLSGEKYVTASLIVPATKGLLRTLQDLQPDVTNLIADLFLGNLIDAVSKRLAPYETNITSSVATFLDPRYKKAAFMVESRANEAETTVQAAVRSQIVRAQQAHSESSDEDTPQHSKYPRLMAFMTDTIARNRSTETATSTAMVLLRPYVSTNPDPDAHPVKYWSEGSSPLHKVGASYCCIPATSVPSERLFSKAGYIISDRRTSHL